MSRKPLLSAMGLSVYVCIVLWAQRTGGSRTHLIDLTGSCLIAVASAGLGWLASKWLTRNSDRRGLVALVAGLWGLLFSSFQLLAETVMGSGMQSPLVAATAWTILCALICWLIARGSRPLSFVTRALGIATIILLVMQIAGAVRSLIPAKTANTVTGKRNSSPNVFIILLDKYSSGAWLAHTYGFDHKPFEDSLRALGFAVPTAARSNYAHTQLSLASFLNWKTFDSTHDKSAMSWNGMRAMIANARAWDVFHQKGYRFVAFPSTFPATRSFEKADLELRPPSHRSAPFGETWWVNSPLASWKLNRCEDPACENSGATPYPIEVIEDIEWKLKTIQSLPDSAGPSVVFLHLLSPHEPYLFGENCASRKPWWPLTDQGSESERINEAYAIQVKCLDHMLLNTVRGLLNRPGPRPVIVLQADHGHGRIAIDPLRGFTLTADELSQARLGERFGVFAAYLFPGADTMVYEDISAVNVMPMVLKSIFGMDLPRQPDRSFWSAYQDAFTFTEVNSAITHPPKAY